MAVGHTKQLKLAGPHGPEPHLVSDRVFAYIFALQGEIAALKEKLNAVVAQDAEVSDLESAASSEPSLPFDEAENDGP